MQLNDSQAEWIKNQVREYILSQRTHYCRYARPLKRTEVSALTGFFPPQILKTVRLCFLQGGRIESPAFYEQLRQWGTSNLPCFEQMAAITLVDVIVSHVPIDEQLLFHELVHVAQYRVLGPDEFARRYVRGFLHGGAYEKIPLEMQAYELDGRFVLAPEKVFSVEQEIDAWLKEGRL